MAHVHPTAQIMDGEGDDVELADDVVIGPHCVLGGRVRIGAGTRLIGHVYGQGPLTIGEANTVYPFACLGFAPQDLKWDPDDTGAGLEIGDRNTFRETVTIHRATSHDTPTTIGDDNYFMAVSHAGHDCRVGDGCVLANNVALGGHVELEDRVTIGGATVIHQFVRIGRGAMLSGGVGTGLDVPPFCTLTGINVVGSLNVIGLRRSGMSRDEINDLRWAYRQMYREHRHPKEAIDTLREYTDRPRIAEIIAFIESTSRGLCSRPRKYTPRNSRT